MAFRFETRETNTQEAVYGGVDWRERRLNQKLAQCGTAGLLEVWMISSDGFELQITQDNCHIRATIDYPDDPTDSMTILDPRDGQLHVWFRSNTEDFDGMTALPRKAGRTILTMYPDEDTIKLFNEHQDADVEQSTSVPESWLIN